jgi:hypothetical protein
MEQYLGLFRDTDGRLVGRGFIANSFATTPNNSIFGRREKLSSKNMPTSSRTKTRISARPVNSMKSERA